MSEETLINASYLIDLSLLSADCLRFSSKMVVLAALDLCGVTLDHDVTSEAFARCKKHLTDKAREAPVPTGLQ